MVSVCPTGSHQLPDHESGENYREAANLAGDQQGHLHLGSPMGVFELVDGVAPCTVADIAGYGSDEEKHDGREQASRKISPAASRVILVSTS
jgi:hypothetical protein